MNSMPFLAGAGLLAGAMNSLAGGGSFVSLPALVAAGLPATLANASSTVALFPGTSVAAWTLRGGLEPIEGVSLRLMAVISFVGGLVGAVLLLVTPEVTFSAMLPWLLLFATVIFSFGKRLGDALRRVTSLGPRSLIAAQVVLSVYGGYFGGGVGITMLAVWSLLGAANLRTLNAVRVMMVTIANGAAVLCFVATGRVAWQETLVMLVAAVVGGYGGARLAGSANPVVLRRIIIVLCCVMTVGFFVRAYA